MRGVRPTLGSERGAGTADSTTLIPDHQKLQHLPLLALPPPCLILCLNCLGM